MKNLGELIVADYMSSPAITVEEKEKLTAAIHLLEQNGLSAVPVVNDDLAVVGVLTSADLLETVHEIQSDIGSLAFLSNKSQDLLVQLLVAQGDTTRVDALMTAPVETVTPQTNMVVAARKMLDCHCHHLPVVDEHNRPLGMLSSFDFVRVVSQLGPLLAG